MSRVRRAALLGALLAPLVATSGCRRAPGGAGAGEAPEALVSGGQYDRAIEVLGESADAESLCLLGRAWAGKAAAAAPALPTVGSDGVADPAPFKPEELKALGYLERAIAARPDLAAAQLALGELLAPHALARRAVPRSGLVAGPDASVDRVLRAFGQALQADPAGTAAGEALVGFALKAGRLSDADAAYRELLNRKREDPEILVRYGDFLAGPRQDPKGALDRYAQALMWRPDDPATRRKMVDIHLRAAAEHLQRQEYVAAESRLTDARRVGVDNGSAQAARLRELQEWLAEVRGR